MFAKTWRVNKIFNNPNAFQRIKVTEKDVLKPYLILMAMNVIVLSCWTVIAPLTYQRFDAPGTDEWNRVLATYGVCSTMNKEKDISAKAFFPYLIVILAINIGLLVLANVQSYRARSVQTEYSESRYITIIMASMLQSFMLAVPVICLLWNIPRVYYVVLVLLIFIMSSVVLGFMFWPKINHTREWMKEKAEKERMDTSDGDVGITRPSVIGTANDDGHDGLKIAVVTSLQFTSRKVKRYIAKSTHPGEGKEDKKEEEEVSGTTNGNANGAKSELDDFKVSSFFVCGAIVDLPLAPLDLMKGYSCPTRHSMRLWQRLLDFEESWRKRICKSYLRM